MTAPVPVTPTEAREAMARALWAKHSGGMSWGAVQSDLRDYFLGLADAALAALPAEPAADARLDEPVRDCEGRTHADLAYGTCCHDRPLPDWPTEDDTDWYGATTGDSPPKTGGMVPEDDTERVERVASALLATRDTGPLMYVETQGNDEQWAREVAEVAIAALSPAQPDPATVERARAEGREQGLREAEQAVRALTPNLSDCVEVRAVVRAIAALASAAPTDEETRP